MASNTTSQWQEVLQDRLLGCLFGTAIGDAMGMPFEWLTRSAIQDYYIGRVTGFMNPTAGHRQHRHLQAGDFTDDTWLTLCLLRSIVRQKRFDGDDFRRELAKWWRELEKGTYNRGAGSTTIEAARNLASGKRTAGRPSATCGAAIRVSPIGLLCASNDMMAAELAIKYAKITHTHPTAVAGAAVVASTLAWLVAEPSPKVADLIKQARDIAQDIPGSDLAEQIDETIDRLKYGNYRRVLPTGESADTRDVIPSALGYLYITDGDFRRTALLAAGGGGDADSIASIACAFTGAICGCESLPREWIQMLRKRNPDEIKELEDLGRRLCSIVIQKLPGALPKLKRWQAQDINRESIKKKLASELKRKGRVRLPLAAKKWRIPIAEIDEMASEIPNVVRAPDRPTLVALNEPGGIYSGRQLAELARAGHEEERIGSLFIKLLDSEDINVRNGAAANLVYMGYTNALKPLRESGLRSEANLLARTAYSARVTALAERLARHVVEGEPVTLRIIIGEQKHTESLEKDTLIPAFEDHMENEKWENRVLIRSVDGGILFINFEGRTSGVYSSPSGESYKFFAPISDGPLVELSEEKELIVFSIYSRTSKIYRFDNGKPWGQQVALRSIQLEEIIQERGIERELVDYVLALAHEISVKSRHGAILCTVRQGDVANANDWKRFEDPIDIREWPIDRLVACASHDGAMLVDSNSGGVLGYEYMFTVTEEQEKEALKKSRELLQTHGARHRKAAAYSVKNPNSVVIVISERGPVTCFASGATILRFE